MFWKKRKTYQPKPSKRRIYVLAVTLPLLLILIPAVYFGLRFASKTQAVWMDDAWAYRVKIPVTAHTSPETNVYFTKTVDTSDTTKFQADCGDIRFTDASGKVLQYYIASGCSSASTVIHVLVPSFALGATDYYLYYGNPNASNGFSSSDFSAGTGVTVGSVGSEEKGNGPIAYWSFDEGTGTTIHDASPNSITGTASGVFWEQNDLCVLGTCLLFQGGTSQISASSNNALKLQSHTISAWIRPQTSSCGGNKCIIASYSNNISTGGAEWGLDSSGKLNFAYYDGSVRGWYTDTGSAVTMNAWSLVTITWNQSAGQVKFYINGSLNSTVSTNTSAITYGSETFLIGYQTQNDRFNGYMDGVKIYNYTRSDAQVKADYNTKSSGEGLGVAQGISNQKSLSSGLVGYWKLDEASGQTKDCTASPFTDSSGNGNHGKSCPSTTGPDGGGIGKFGNAVTFDGSNDYIDVATATSLHPGDTFTLSAWVKRSSTGTFDAVIGTSGNDYQLAFVNDNIKLSKQSTADVFVSTSTYTDTTSWHHIVAVKNGSTSAAVYYDGVQIAGTYTDQTIVAGSSSIYIGGDGNGSDIFAGSIDEVRIYNRALSEQEVRQLYTFAPGPVGYWKFDENTGTTAYDSSGNGSNATLTNSPTWSQGKYGSGLLVGSSSQYAFYDDSGTSPLDITSSFTVSAWAKFDSLANNYQVVALKSKNNTNTANWFIGTDTGANKDELNCGFWDTSQGTVASTNLNLVTGRWYFIECAFNDDANTVIMYVDGVQIAQQTSVTNAPPTGSGDLYIGDDSTLTWNGSPLNGTVDEVKIYNYVRTPSQVIEDMNGSHPLGGSPVGSQLIYWPMDEQALAAIHNTGSGGSTYDGTANGPAWSTITVPVCKVNGCLYFDSSSDYTSASLGTLLDGTTAFSTSLWIKPTALNGGTMIASKANTSTQRAFAILEDSANSNTEIKVMISSSASDTSNYCITSGFGLSTSTWQHLTVVYDGSQATGNNNRVKVYKNATPISCTVTGTIPTSLPTTTSNLKLGQGDDTGINSTIAYMDEFKFYTAALTTDQVKLEANFGASTAYSTGADEVTQITGSAETVGIAYWPFEEGSGTTTYNRFGTNYDGTLNNTPTWSIPSQCKIGKCLSFASSSNQDVSVANTVSGIKTVSFWAKPTSTTTSLLQLQASGAVAITASAGTLSATGFTSPTIYVNGNISSTIVANVWQYITVTTGTGISGSAIKFGHVNATYYDGLLDEIKMYNYARTKAQVNYDFNRGAPIGWWQFDDCQGTTARDASGNGNDATLTYGGGTYTQVGTCNSGTSSDAWYGGAVGRFNGGIAIDTTTDTISIGDIALYNFERTDPFTTSIWFKTSSLQSTTLFSKQESSGNFRGWNIQTDSVGKLYFQFVNVYSSNILEVRTTPNLTYNDSNWHNVTTTYDGSVTWAGIHIYYDGRDMPLTNDFSQSLSATTQTTTPVYIGSRNGTAQKWSGFLDDARLYNYALSATQVKKLFQGGSSTNFGPASGSP